MPFATSLIGGARRAASARGLTPQEQAMYEAMQADIKPAMTRPTAPQARPLIGGQMSSAPMPKPMTRPGGPTGQYKGMLSEGNIDLTKRPQVRNPDGSISSVLSASFGTDKGEVLVPLVSDDGRIMSEQEALDQYRRTGRNLGIFDNPEDANAYAQALHEAQAAYKPQQQPQPKKPPSMWDGIAQDPLAFLLRGADGVVERQKQQQFYSALDGMNLSPEERARAEMDPEGFFRALNTPPTGVNLGDGAYATYKNGKLEMLRQPNAPPKKYTAYRPGDVVYGDKNGDGIEEEIFRIPDNDPAKTVNSQRITGDDGFVYSWNPQTNETKQVMGPNGKPLRAKESSGVTINMPGNVREGVDPVTGRPAFVGIDPQDPNGGFKVIPGANPQSNMMSAETRSKFLALAPNAFAGISRLEELFGGKSEDPLSGKGALAAVASNIPFVGDVAARGIGGQEWQDFDQAWNAIELGVHIPAGAAVSPSEAERFLRANKPALNETQATKLRKIANVKRFYQGLEAGFNGDWNGLQSLLKEAPPSDGKGGGGKASATPLDAEEQAMVNELRKLGKSQAEIDAILGQ